MIPADLIQLQLPLRLCSVAALSRYQDPGTGFRGAWFVWPTRSLGLIMPCHAIPCRCPFNSRYLAIRMPVTRYSFHNSRQHCSLTVSSIQFHRRRVQSLVVQHTAPRSSHPRSTVAAVDPIAVSQRLGFPRWGGGAWSCRGLHGWVQSRHHNPANRSPAHLPVPALSDRGQ